MPQSLQFLNNAGEDPARLYGPATKTTYDFTTNESGVRVCDNVDDGDAEYFLGLVDNWGNAVFAENKPVTAEFDPATKNYDEISREDLRALYQERTGKPAPGRMRNDTLIEELQALDAQEVALALQPVNSAEEPETSSDETDGVAG